MTTRRDVCIIGAGPVGLFTVFACGQLGMRCAVIDALPEAGGQCAALYPEKPIYDIPTRSAITGGDLIAALVEQAAPYDPDYRYGDTVRTIEDEPDGGFTVRTAAGATIAARAVIVAAGGGAFGPNRPPLPGIRDYEGTSVHYHVARKEAFRGKRVVIAGGGDSAIDWALDLAPLAGRITLVHRRDRFRAIPENVAKVRDLAAHGALDILTPFQLSALEGEGGVLRAVVLADEDGNPRRVEADMLLALFGIASDLSAVGSWGVAVEHGTVTVAPATMETSRAGIFAVGDVAGYPGKLKLILQGFSEAAVAAHAAYHRVFPDRALHFQHSTSRGRPGLSPVAA